MKFISSLFLLLFITQTFAAEDTSLRHTIYGGVGKSESDNDKSDKNPWSVGYLYHLNNTKYFLGLDFSREGTSIDNTSGKYNEVSEGHSLNFAIGRDFNFDSDWGAGFGILLGGRETEKSCSDSYLGYQCYADEDPDKEYEFNYGALLSMTFKNVLIGARISGESSQAIFGFNF